MSNESVAFGGSWAALDSFESGGSLFAVARSFILKEDDPDATAAFNVAGISGCSGGT
jgi:hypothetical protein